MLKKISVFLSKELEKKLKGSDNERLLFVLNKALTLPGHIIHLGLSHTQVTMSFYGRMVLGAGYDLAKHEWIKDAVSNAYRIEMHLCSYNTFIQIELKFYARGKKAAFKEIHLLTDHKSGFVPLSWPTNNAEK